MRRLLMMLSIITLSVALSGCIWWPGPDGGDGGGQMGGPGGGGGPGCGGGGPGGGGPGGHG